MTTSLLVNMHRDIISVLHPLTGTRATGVATITASGSDVPLPVGSYLVPVVEGEYRDDLAYKVLRGPNTDRSWTVTSIGTAVNITANLGGSKFNLADATDLYFDPAISGIASSVVTGAITTGANPSSLGLQDVQFFERFTPPPDGLDMSRAIAKQSPSAVLTWIGSEPADGSAVAQNLQGSRTGQGRGLYHEIFDLYVFTASSKSDHLRRQDGFRLLDGATLLLTSRKNSDDVGISTPSGIQIRRRWRHNFTNHSGTQRYYAYGLELAAMTAWERTDTRSYDDLATFMIDILKPQSPALPDQGDFTMVDDMEVDNT